MFSLSLYQLVSFPIFQMYLFCCFDHSNRPLVMMNSALCESLQKQILLTFNWTQELIYNPSDGLSFVKFAKAVGSNPNILKNCYDQPAEDKFLSGSYFVFHPFIKV